MITNRWEEYLCKESKDHDLSNREHKLLLCFPNPEMEIDSKSECTTLDTKICTKYCEITGTGESTYNKIKRGIFNKFSIDNNERKKLEKLNSIINIGYEEYLSSVNYFEQFGLTRVYKNFPTDIFREKIAETYNFGKKGKEREIAILQTFAPNLEYFQNEIIVAIRKGVTFKILLAFPGSRAVTVRQDALYRYKNGDFDLEENDMDISKKIKDNLGTIRNIIKSIDEKSNQVIVKLYDSIPSMSIYRAGNYILAGVFLHGKLAIDTFQLELDLNMQNPYIANELESGFLKMWHIARDFTSQLQNSKNWENDLEELFAKKDLI